MAAQKMPKTSCDFFSRFGACGKGWECDRKHEKESFPGKTFVGQVKKIDREYTSVSRGSEIGRYALTKDHYWLLQGAKEGDWVIFQTSKCHNSKNRQYGRVVIVLDYADDIIPSMFGGKLYEVINDAFAIDQLDTEKRDDVLSIEQCLDEKHESCKKIGIHIIANNACYKEKLLGLPRFNGKFEFEKGRGSFKLNQACLSISVYAHTVTDEMSEPKLTVVKVTKFYTFENVKQEFRDFKILSKRFIKEETLSKLNATSGFKALQGGPNRCEAVLAVTGCALAYWTAVQRYLSTEKDALVITCALPETAADQKYSLFCKSDLERLETFWRDANEVSANYMLLGLGGFQTSEAFNSEYLNSKKWLCDVEFARNMPKNRATKCTSPERNAFHFVNRQILIRALLGESPLYDRADLLGIICIRYSTPKLTKAIIGRLDQDTFNADYPEIDNMNRSIMQISYREMGSDDIAPFPEDGYDTRKLRWTNLRCDSPTNDQVVKIDKAKLRKLRSGLGSGEAKDGDNVEVKSLFDCVLNEKTEPAYSCTNGVQLHLRQGIVISLQIGVRESWLPDGLGLRLLKAGANCHVCLTHINHPELAFMSDREDLKGWVRKDRIESLKASLEEKKVHDSVLVDGVVWEGDYNAGGSFTSNMDISAGDFLCIRKDLDTYVWNAHAVATANDSESKKITFSICTLFQDERICRGRDDAKYVVEVIQAPAKPSFDGSR